ncbi:MAG: hypothetical protein J5518_03655 [Lachnospiraceae bacterium]|nr:hypothetical protein [Lachnospiraceae bacterium]
MRINDFRETIKRREYVEKVSHGEWAEGIEECWKQEIEILTEDIPSTIEFLNNECTAEEYSWISEVFEDVIEKNPSKDLVQCYRSLMEKFPEESATYDVTSRIEGAEAILNWEADNGKKN